MSKVPTHEEKLEATFQKIRDTFDEAHREAVELGDRFDRLRDELSREKTKDPEPSKDPSLVPLHEFEPVERQIIAAREGEAVLAVTPEHLSRLIWRPGPLDLDGFRQEILARVQKSSALTDGMTRDAVIDVIQKLVQST